MLLWCSGKYFRTFMDVFMFYLLLGLSWAAENPFRSEIAPVTLSNSTQGTMDVLIAIPQGFHLYKDMMSVRTRDTIGIAFQEPILPKGLFQPDPANPSMYREHYEETIMIHVPFSVTGDGDHTSEVEVRYQGCKKGSLVYFTY